MPQDDRCLVLSCSVPVYVTRAVVRRNNGRIFGKETVESNNNHFIN